jgi:hypothetical protein
MAVDKARPDDLKSDSLLQDVRLAGDPQPRTWPRRVTLAVLLLVVVAGATGFLGTHTRTATVTSGGYRMSLTYAWVARPGQDVPWRVHVRCPGGCRDDITLAVSDEYFRIYETQGFYPQFSESTSDGKFDYLTFSAPPPGHDFGVEYDAYIQPGSHTGAPATVRLIIAGRLITELRIHTWLVP